MTARPALPPPANAVRCVACNGPFPMPDIPGPYQCADCGRHIYASDGLDHPGHHWEFRDGWLISARTC